MRTLACALAALLCTAPAIAETGPWTAYTKRDPMVFWRAGLEVGMLEDPHAELVNRCRTDWSKPYALRFKHAVTGETVTVVCAEVRD